MKSSGTSDHLVTRSILASPKSFLNCQALSIHLPPPSPAQNSSSRSAYISPPMSASSRFPQALKSPRSQAKHQRQRSTPPLTDPSAPAHLGSFNGRRAPDASLQPQQLRKSPTEGRRNIRETDVDRPNTPVTLGGGTPPPAEGSNDECSPRTQGSSNAPQSNSDSPNIARRAKAHVPSACVNCKRKHLACETRRPCSRCVQAGKEATCVDVQHKKRGRPRLREEENDRGDGFSGGYIHPHLHLGQPDMASIAAASQRGPRRTGSYRELRSLPSTHYEDTHAGVYMSGGMPDSGYAISPHLHGGIPLRQPPPARALSEQIPTALLSLDFVIARSNRAFSDALCLAPSGQPQALMDLVITSEREKISRLQNSLRADRNLGDPVYLAPMHGSDNELDAISSTEEHDIDRAMTGFQTRSEYWTFRLPDDQSRGFPVSISLAKTSVYFVILTLVQRVPPLVPLPSPRSTPQELWSQPSHPVCSGTGVGSPTSTSIPRHRLGSGSSVSNDPGHHSHVRPLAPPALVSRPQILQSGYDRGLGQYQSYMSQSRASTNTAGSTPPLRSATPVVRSPIQEIPRDSLRHLQLPPIRTSGINEPRDVPRRERHHGQGRPEQIDTRSPQSAHRKKKRRRVDIGEMLE